MELILRRGESIRRLMKLTFEFPVKGSFVFVDVYVNISLSKLSKVFAVEFLRKTHAERSSERDSHTSHFSMRRRAEVSFYTYYFGQFIAVTLCKFGEAYLSSIASRSQSANSLIC